MEFSFFFSKQLFTWTSFPSCYVDKVHRYSLVPAKHSAGENAETQLFIPSRTPLRMCRVLDPA